jgi:hypothetical protein
VAIHAADAGKAGQAVKSSEKAVVTEVKQQQKAAPQAAARIETWPGFRGGALCHSSGSRTRLDVSRQARFSGMA